MKTILTTLETKQSELLKKLDENKKNLSSTKAKEKRDKLKLLKHTYEQQREKIEKQLDYVRLSLSLESLRHQASINPSTMTSQDGAKLASMTQKLSDMYAYMKNENKSYMRKQTLPNSTGTSAAGTGASASGATGDITNTDSTASANVQVAPRAPSPTAKLSSVYEVVRNALAALLAHTAATAHSAAAIAYMNYYYYTMYQQQQQQLQQLEKNDQAPVKPIVPLKTEIEKASSTFSKYKSKISSFFELTKQEKSADATTSKLANKEFTGLRQIIEAYTEKANSMTHDDQTIKHTNEKHVDSSTTTATGGATDDKKPIKMTNQTGSLLDDDEDVDSDMDYMELVTTSELKNEHGRQTRNYLLPSLKSSYFPLKASLDASRLKESTNCTYRSASSLIAVEKSQNAMTFLGQSSSVVCFGSQKRVKLNDILFNK